MFRVVLRLFNQDALCLEKHQENKTQYQLMKEPVWKI